MTTRAPGVIVLAISGALSLVTAAGCNKSAAVVRQPALVAPLGAPSAPGTSRESLERTITAAEARLRVAPADEAAGVRLADALLRQARVLSNPGLAIRAELVLRTALASNPERYDARRMLATVLLSQHKFRDSIQEAERCQQVRPADAWLFGILGDAHLELGEYDAAFAAFDRMAAIRPDAASYARISYARELQGNLDEAIRLMSMALEATGPNDPESIAWHHAQLGHLHLTQGNLDAAARDYAHADYVFPDHPFAIEGRARVASARGQHADALALAERAIATAPSPSLLAFSADQLRALGRGAEADRADALAEAAWRTDAPEPARLALFLAQRGRNLDEAVALAESTLRDRDDIFTNDALAWAYYRAGRIDDAVRASARAMRTGVQNHEMRERARVITQAAHTAHAAGAPPAPATRSSTGSR